MFEALAGHCDVPASPRNNPEVLPTPADEPLSFVLQSCGYLRVKMIAMPCRA